MDEKEIKELFKHAKADPTLLSKIDVNELVAAMNDTKNDYLEDKSLEDISREVYTVLNDLGKLSEKKIEQFCQNLLEYRYVDEVYKLHNGKPIKWFKINPVEKEENKQWMRSGGICTGVNFRDNGTYVSCLALYGRTFFQIKFDDHLIFQKLTEGEQLILMAKNIL